MSAPRASRTEPGTPDAATSRTTRSPVVIGTSPPADRAAETLGTTENRGVPGSSPGPPSDELPANQQFSQLLPRHCAWRLSDKEAREVPNEVPNRDTQAPTYPRIHEDARLPFATGQPSRLGACACARVMPGAGVRPSTPRTPAHGPRLGGWSVIVTDRKPLMLTPVVTYLGPPHRLRPTPLRGEFVSAPSACATQTEVSGR